MDSQNIILEYISLPEFRMCTEVCEIFIKSERAKDLLILNPFQ